MFRKEIGDPYYSVPESLPRIMLREGRVASTKKKVTGKKIFDDLFSKDQLLATYLEHFSRNSVKGIDRINGLQFLGRSALELEGSAGRCQDDRYRFAPYLEQLRLKGRGKIPRVIGIPTVRDRVILKQLNKLLAQILPESIPENIASSYVAKVACAIQASDTNSTMVYGCDIENFYGSIDREILLSKLRRRIRHKPIINLIRRAITTPAVPGGSRRSEQKKFFEKVGVPQGLAISNILASIYMRSIDDAIKEMDVLYFRYVDDILIVGTTKEVEQAQERLEQLLKKHRLKAHKIGSGKTHFSKLTDTFGYLGYIFQHPNISVRTSSQENFLRSVVAKFSEYTHSKETKLEKYKYLNEERLKSIFLLELNERITGAISEKRRYGWIAYFSQINDLTALYHLDGVIEKLFARLEDFNHQAPNNVKKLSRAIFEIRYRPTGGYIHNYDLLVTREQKLKFLVERGRIGDEERLSDEQIQNRFERYRMFILSQLQRDEAKLY